MKGKADHPMEDYHVAKFVRVGEHEVGLFAIYDGHLGDEVPSYLQKHLFANILDEVGFLCILNFQLLFETYNAVETFEQLASHLLVCFD